MNGKKEDSFFIPKKLAVGFNKRSDTYTGKIGFIANKNGKKCCKVCHSILKQETID